MANSGVYIGAAVGGWIVGAIDGRRDERVWGVEFATAFAAGVVVPGGVDGFVCADGGGELADLSGWGGQF